VKIKKADRLWLINYIFDVLIEMGCKKIFVKMGKIRF